jgi:hypothetical protein
MFSFLAASYGSLSDIEIAWTLLAAIGLIFSIFNVREAYADWTSLKDLPMREGNSRPLIAWNSLKTEAASSVIQILFGTIGILSMLLPQTSDQLDLPLKQLLISITIRWGLLIGATLLALKSYWTFSMRREFLRELERHKVTREDRAGFEDDLDEARQDSLRQ